MSSEDFLFSATVNRMRREHKRQIRRRGILVLLMFATFALVGAVWSTL